MTRKIIVTDSPYLPDVPNGTVMTVTNEYPEGQVNATVDGGGAFEWFIKPSAFKEYTPDTPVLWQNMTPEQKGAIVLAYWEVGIEASLSGKVWYPASPNQNQNEPAFRDDLYVRRKPAPKVETVTIASLGEMNHWIRNGDLSKVKDSDGKWRITFNLIDGKPDCDSVKMMPINE